MVHLGQLSVTTNPLSTHTTHAIPPLDDGIQFIDFVELDNHIHTLCWDESEPEPIVADGIYEVGGMTLGQWMPTPFKFSLYDASMIYHS